MRTLIAALVAGLTLTAGAAVAPAQVTSQPTLATNNATVLPTGPRAGANGKAFFNVEGTTPGGATFSSYGVADFASTAGAVAPGSVTAVSGVRVTLTQSNAAFTAGGSLAFFLATNTATSIEPGASPLAFSAANPPTGITAAQGLGTVIPLGTGTFAQGTAATSPTGTANGTGTVDTYLLTALSGDAQAYLVSQLNAGGPLRLLVAPNDATVAATYAGSTNPTLAGPQVAFTGAFTPVPEPATVGLAGAAALGAGAVVRRRFRPAAG